MSLSELIALSVFCVAMTFTPGPNTMLTTAIASNYGLRHVIPFTLGVPCGWALIQVICGLGIGTLVIQIPLLRWLIQLIGCLYLLWLAWTLSRSTMLIPLGEKPLKISFSKGILLQFLNIKVWLLAITVTGSWVIQSENSTGNHEMQRLILCTAILMFFAFASNLTYALLGSSARKWLMHGRRLLIFNRLLASLLAITAIWTLSL